MITLLSLLLLSTNAHAADVRLAVLEFADSSSDAQYDALGKGLQSMLTTDLSKVPDTEMVERARLQALLDELDLGQSGKVAASTAAKIGELSGASHLVDGSFTVVGDTMRLDARLVDVTTGKVVVAESVEGEREAFFEIEKDLVKVLVKGIGIELAPKDRAAIGRLHTADFEAFAEFSKGIALFDEERFDDAMKALDKAIVRDEDFKLAAMTHKQFNEIITGLQDREQALRVAKIEAKRFEEAEEAAETIAMLKKLREYTEEEGEAGAHHRITALYVLAGMYDDGRGLSDLFEQLDRFQNQRLAEHYWQRYYVEAEARWPELPLTWNGRKIIHADEFDEDFEEQVVALWGTDKEQAYLHEKRWKNLDDCGSQSDFGELLQLDMTQRVDLCASYRQLGTDIGADDEWYRTLGWRLSTRQADAGQYSKATRNLAAYLETLDNERHIADWRENIEDWRDMAAAVDKSQDKALVQELIMLSQVGRTSTYYQMKPHDFALQHLGGAEPTAFGLDILNRKRRLSELEDDPFFFGEHPLYFINGRRNLTSGARSDMLRSSMLSFYRIPDQKGSTFVHERTMAIVDGRPAEALSASFELSWLPDEQWWPHNVLPTEGDDDLRWTDLGKYMDSGKPAFGFMIGATDINVPFRKDPETRKSELHRPMKTWMVTIDPDEVRLVAWTESDRDYRRRAYDEVVVGKLARKDKGKDVAKVAIDVTEGGAVSVALDGKKHAFQIDDYQGGMYGFVVDANGFVRVQQLRIH